MRIAVIVANLGPYHRARLQASAEVCHLTAVQVFARSSEYAWQTEIRPRGYKVITLFKDDTDPVPGMGELDRRMNQALDECRPQIVFIPGWSGRAAFSALGWSVRRGIPAVAMSDSTAWDERRVGWKEWIKKRIVRLFSAALVAGNPQRDYLVQLGFPRERIFLGYDAVDNDYFRQKADEIRAPGSEVGMRYALPKNYFLASARFMEKKNLPRLLRAYARYRADSGEPGSDAEEPFNSEPWSLVLLGDGPLQTEICRLISELALDGSVQIPGFRPYSELPLYYALAGAFIHASVSEQWGLVVNEAMASRLPVLVSDLCGCASDLVQEGCNGFLFDPYDVDGCAGLMRRISRMPLAVRNEMGRESGLIIAEWGLDCFVRGFDQAARQAREIGAPWASWLDRRLLQGLLLR
jgi:1,2-diacylglycerol 3-alpha-glucosyltransferase